MMRMICAIVRALSLRRSEPARAVGRGPEATQRRGSGHLAPVPGYTALANDTEPNGTCSGPANEWRNRMVTVSKISRRDGRAETEAEYRDRFKFDRVSWGSHCIDCYPGNCPYRVYVRDGSIVFEEQSGTLPVIEKGVPDMNPMGCQKGANWSRTLNGGERIHWPLKRVGKRGSGQWERVSWEQACNEVADGIIDAIQEQGPESMIALSGCNMSTWGVTGRTRFFSQIGGITTDLNAEMNDFSPGHYLTYGKFDPVSSIDDWFHADVFFIWFSNPAFTRIP
ncbi:MAG: hypothetical protein EPO22_14115, partial [Dehalococcoidia bacterium]